MRINRRQFVKKSSVSLALGMMANSVFDLLLPRRAEAFDPGTLSSPLPIGTPILVLIDLLGGNDTLNTHVPYAVPGASGHYFTDRPALSFKNVTTTRPYLAPSGSGANVPALDLDGQYALHPALPWLANRWFSHGDVAIVQGVGENVAVERSHFASQAYRESAAFHGPKLESGWLGRFNDIRNQNQVLASISLNSVSRSLIGLATPVISVPDVATFEWKVNTTIPFRAAFQSRFTTMGDPSFPPELNKAWHAAQAIRNVNSAASLLKPTAQPALNTGLTAGTLAHQLAQAAMMITAGIPCQTYAARLSGFDLHGTQSYYHQLYLSQVDLALSRFFAAIDASPRAGDVVVLLTSEFGRSVKENAGAGTDHGRASSTILVGGGVQGGVYGQMPDLTVRDFDAIIPTVDFRSVFATVLNHLGGDVGLTREVLGQDESDTDFEDLGIFA